MKKKERKNTAKLTVQKALKKAKEDFIDIAARPKAALLFWFFGGFRCGVL